MLINRFFFILSALFLLLSNGYAEVRAIALTIDDLPFVGEARQFHLNKIIDTLTQYQVPATGFIIAKEVSKRDYPVLQRFRDAGLGLGNHSFSHANANRVSLAQYLDEIQQSDISLSLFLTQPKFYRFPYLAEGRAEGKQAIAASLKEKGYFVAPVTVDSKDYKYNQLLMSVPEWERRHFLSQLTPIYLDYIWKQTQRSEKGIARGRPQILLVHANLLTTYTLPAMITMFRQRGYQFVSLEDALRMKPAPLHAVHEVLRDTWPLLDLAGWEARYRQIVAHAVAAEELATPELMLAQQSRGSRARIDRMIRNAFAWD